MCVAALIIPIGHKINAILRFLSHEIEYSSWGQFATRLFGDVIRHSLPSSFFPYSSQAFHCTEMYTPAATFRNIDSVPFFEHPLRVHLHVVGMLRFMFFDINQTSLPTPFYSVLVSVSVVTMMTFRCVMSQSGGQQPKGDPIFHGRCTLSHDQT